MNVRLTTHALTQARDRGADAATMQADVTAAAAAGRKAKSKPRWASISGRRGFALRNGGAGTTRFLWNAAETRCYVCRRIAGGWLVITVLERVSE